MESVRGASPPGRIMGSVELTGALVAGVLVAAAYGAGAGFLARDRLAQGRHRRYADEWQRPLPTYRFLPAAFALVAALLAVRLATAGPAVAAPYVAAVPLYGVLAAVDVDVHRLPDRLTLPAYPALALALAPAAWRGDGGPGAARRAVLAGVVALVAFAVLHVVSRRALGHGDVKLAGTLGALLGWFSWERLLGGIYAMFLIGGVVAGWLLLRRRAGRHTRLAFGPAMVLGAAAAILAVPPGPG